MFEMWNSVSNGKVELQHVHLQVPQPHHSGGSIKGTCIFYILFIFYASIKAHSEFPTLMYVYRKWLILLPK